MMFQPNEAQFGKQFSFFTVEKMISKWYKYVYLVAKRVCAQCIIKLLWVGFKKEAHGGSPFGHTSRCFEHKIHFVYGQGLVTNF